MAGRPKHMRPAIDRPRRTVVRKGMALVPEKRRVRWVGCILVTILTFVAANAVCASRPSPQKQFVWRVTNVAAPFYLVGSLHTLTKDDFPHPRTYREALASSERLLFEYDPRRRAALARLFHEAGRYPPHQNIESEVRPRTLALLKKNLWRFGMKFEEVRNYRPWSIALRLLAKRGPTGPSSPVSMESQIVSEAQRSGKEVGGLETIEEHVAFWSEMLEHDSENLLVYVLAADDRINALFARTRAAWMRGDLAALSATNKRLRQANPGIAQRLLDRRNLRWARRIEAELESGKPTAVVAGAGHFSGSGSVVAILKERGYQVERL